MNLSTPSYSRFCSDVFTTFQTAWTKMDPFYKTPQGWLHMLKENCFVTYEEVLYTIILAVFWTFLRVILSAFILKPIARMLKLPPNEAEKAPESAWKLIFYTATWSYSVYLLFFTKYNFFHDVSQVVYGWSVGMDIPTDIYVAYMVQMSFYLHSVYGTLFMDVWRKDSIVMLAHHAVTMMLIGFSYAFRYVNIGLLILFCHDITDIVLEATKLTLYCKTKGGKWYHICNFLSSVGFLIFGTAWYVFRLYWYPLKAMYAAGYMCHISIEGGPPFYFFLNSLLWILLFMNIYWFGFIINMAFKVVTGQADEIEDVRSYEEKLQSQDNGKLKSQ